MMADKFTDALPIMKWLIEQRNEQGGFQSTQDTIVGLHALAKFAEKISSNNTNLEVAIKYDDKVKAKINVDKNNAIILQSHEVIRSKLLHIYLNIIKILTFFPYKDSFINTFN